MKTRSKLMSRFLKLALCLCMVLAMLPAIQLVTEVTAATCTHVDESKDGRCDLCKEPMAPVQLIKTSASLEGNIAVNYFLLLSDEVLADETAYMQFTMADGEIIKVPVKDSKLIDGYDVFTCEVAAKEMTDIITSQFYYGGEPAFDKDHQYNVRAYAKHVMENYDDANIKNLMEAMVNYGAASQAHFGHNTEEPANSILDTKPDYSNMAITGYDVIRGQGTENVKFYSATLILNSETTLRFFFNGNVTATYEGQNLPVKYRGGLYYVDVVDIAAKDLDEDVTITINDGTESANITFNPITYCQLILNDTTGAYTTEMRELVYALYLYSQAANAYFVNDGPQGATLYNALRYLNSNGDEITSQVTSVTFGRSNTYRDIANTYGGTLVDVEQDAPAYAYYVPNASGYDLYVLSNDVVYAPKDSTGLFRGMTNLTSVNTDNFDVSRVKLAKFMFRQCTKLQTLNTTGWDTSNITDMYGVFYQCSALTEIPGIESWDTSAATTMRGFFRQCGVSGDLDLTGWDVSNVTTMQQLFYSCPNIVNVNATGWDTGACTEMNYMFNKCSNLQTLQAAGWDTSEVTTMYAMFADCGKLTTLDATGWTNSKVTSVMSMFINNSALTTVKGSGGWNFASATDMECMFENCSNLTELDVTNWNMSKANTVWNMFARCKKLVTLKGEENWTLSSATNTNFMFQGCNVLTGLDVQNWDMQKVTEMSCMFQYCYQLEYLDVSKWNTGNCQYFNSTFADCTKLKFDEDAFVNWNMTSAIRIDHMFDESTSIEALNLSGWNMPNMITTSHMFADCTSLKSIKFTGWNTPKLYSLDAMFNDCDDLTYLDVSSFDTATCEEFSQIFEGCKRLVKIDGLQNWDTNKARTYESTFSGCQALTELDLTTFNTRNVVNDHLMEWQPNSEPNIGRGCYLMFSNMTSLEKLVLSADFSFDGDGKVTTESYKVSLPAPANSEGVWYDEDGKAYLPSEIPEETATTYVAHYEYIPKGATLQNALHYLNADPNGTSITANVTSVTFGLREDYETITSQYTGVLADAEQDAPAYAYYAPNASGYDVYVLSDDVIYAPKNSTKLFGNMSKLTSVETDNFDVSRVTNAYQMFIKCAALKEIDVSEWDVSNVTDMTAIFYMCNALKTIPGIENWDTSSCTTLYCAFYKMQSLESLDLSGWDVSKVTDLRMACFGNPNLRSLNIAGWNIASACNATSAFSGNSVLTELDATGMNTSGITNANAMFSGCQALTELNGSGDWYMPNNTNMYQMFLNCVALESIDVSSWDTGSCTNYHDLFCGCTSLKTITGLGNWDTSSAINMISMFNGCASLENVGDLSSWDMRNVNDIGYMFYGCSSLQEVNGIGQWDTGNVTSMHSTFELCTSLEKLELGGWDTSKVTDFGRMFKTKGNTGNMKFTELDVSNWDVSSAIDMNCMFYGCGQLTSLDLRSWDVSNVQTISHMFADCYKLEQVNLTGWNTPALTTVDALFNNCGSLKSVDVSSFDTAKVVEFSQAFEYCYSLERIIGLDKWDTSSGQDFGEMFSSCNKLKELDLSSFNTTNAQDSYVNPSNGDGNDRFNSFLSGCTSLEKITLGKKFSFDGDGSFTTWTFVMPSATNVEGWDGYWYDADGNPYLPSEIPEETARTYYAVKPVNP